MLFKTALRNLRKNPVMNAMCFLQLVAVFTMTAVMVSSMSIRYRTYNPVKDILESSGLYCEFNGFLGGVTKPGEDPTDIAKNAIITAEELSGYMKEDEMYCIKTAIMGQMNIDKIPAPLFYDSELIKRYAPPLKEGRWLNPDADELEIVIPDDTYGVSVGDSLELPVNQYKGTIRENAKVVGILEDGAEILGRNRPHDTRGDTHRNFFEPYYIEVEEGNMPVFLASSDVFYKLHPEAQLFFVRVFFIYDNPEDVRPAQKTASQLNALFTETLSEINENSKAYLREQLLQILPIAVVLMILVIVNSMSVSAIITKKRLKDYAMFYILGLQWKQCAVVNLLQSLTVGAAALVTSIILQLAVGITPLSKTIIIIWNSGLALAFLGIFALYLIFSMIMPLVMLRSTTPKALLQAE